MLTPDSFGIRAGLWSRSTPGIVRAVTSGFEPALACWASESPVSNDLQDRGCVGRDDDTVSSEAFCLV